MVWIENPRAKPRRRVGLVELLGGDLRRRPFVHPHLLGPTPGGLGGALHHDVAPDLVGVVAQPVRVAAAGRREQQPRRLDGVAGERDEPGALQPVLPVAGVDDAAGGAGGVVDLDAQRHGVGADLDAVRECVGQVRDVRAGLGVDLAALQAVAAVDAVRPVAEGAVDDADRSDPHLDPARQSAPARSLSAAPVTGCGENG